jgi:hypothetical protein
MASMARDIRFDPARLLRDDGTVKEIHELDEPTRLALRVERDADGKLKYRSPDKTAAREQAMKHFGLYERDNKQKPFYVPPVIKVIPVPGRGHHATTIEGQPSSPGPVIGVRGKAEK